MGLNQTRTFMATIEAYSRPGFIYRFREITDDTLAREIEAIVDRFVFCPTYKEMNDPMEGNHRESALLRDSPTYGQSIKAVTDALAGFGIASFSESKSHDPMWAHYAGDFEGICIAYSLKALLANLPKKCEFVKMTYNERAPILVKNYATAANRAKLILSCKSIKWAGEREWRLIRPTRGKASYRKAECVTAVYLGSQIDSAHKKAVVDAMAKVDIKVYQMDINSYDLEFKRVPKARPIRKKPPSTGAR